MDSTWNLLSGLLRQVLNVWDSMLFVEVKGFPSLHQYLLTSPCQNHPEWSGALHGAGMLERFRPLPRQHQNDYPPGMNPFRSELLEWAWEKWYPSSNWGSCDNYTITEWLCISFALVQYDILANIHVCITSFSFEHFLMMKATFIESDINLSFFVFMSNKDVFFISYFSANQPVEFQDNEFDIGEGVSKKG